MGFHQSQMSRQVIFLHSEINPAQRMLKPSFKLKQLQDDDSDIYLQTKFQTYLLACILSLTQSFIGGGAQQLLLKTKKASEVESYTIQCKGSDDFGEFMCAKQKFNNALTILSEKLSNCELEVRDGYDLLALCRALQRLNIPKRVFSAIQRYYNDLGIESLPAQQLGCPTEPSHRVAEAIIECIDWTDSDLLSGLSSYHWLMGCNLSDDLISILARYKPGTLLDDADGHYWSRRAKMVCTRHRFISSVGDDQDAMSCLQSAIARGFHTDALRQLAQVYVEHRFLSADEADIFLSEIPVLGKREEPETTVSDHVLDSESTDLGNLVPGRAPEASIEELLQTYTESQLRAFDWVKAELEGGKQVHAAVVGLGEAIYSKG